MQLILSVILFSCLQAWGIDLQIPALSSPVMDEAHLLSDSERMNLAEIAYEIHTQNGPQITILTVNDLQNYPVEEFSIRVAEKWKLGIKEKGNGLLILISKAERKVRIEVGEGIEGDITDYEASSYIRNVLTPNFKRGDFYTGLRLVMEDVAKKFSISLNEGKTRLIRPEARNEISVAYPALFPLILIALLITQIVFRNNSVVRGLFGGLGIASAGFAVFGFFSLFILILFVIGFVFGLMGFHNVLFALAQGGNGGRGNYHGGGGGWSGGGGGFSGGGASGDW